MPIKVNPQNLTGYPGQTLFFDLRSNGSVVPSWKSVTGGTQDAARTLTYTSGGYVEGSGLYQLFGSGNGQFAYTFNSRNLPDTGGTLKFTFQSLIEPDHYMTLTMPPSGVMTLTNIAPDGATWNVSGTTYSYIIGSDGTTETKNLTGTSIAGLDGQRMIAEIIPLVGINIQIGANIRIEWRIGSAIGLGQFAAPFAYTVRMTSPSVSTPPLLVAPELVGDWRPGSAASWTLDSTAGGQLSLPSSTSYQNNLGIGTAALPGMYRITAAQAAIASSQLDDAVAVLTIPAFTVNSDVNITMEPSEVRRFSTNFDDVPTVSVTRSASSGTWAGLSYTAPATAGTYTLTFVAAGQTRIVTVVVAPSLTPSWEYVIPGESITFTTMMSGTLTWPSTLGGNSLTGSGTSRTWVVPNSIGAMFRLSITNGTDTINRDLTVLEAFPYACQIPLDGTHGKVSVVESLADGTVVGRVKRQGNRATDNFTLAFANRETTELEAALTFFDKNYPQRRFIVQDLARSKRYAVRFVDAVRYQVRTPNDCSYSFAVTED